MKKRIIHYFAVWSILALFLGFLSFSSCDSDNSTNGGDKGPADVSGELRLPAKAEGKSWIVIFDNDINGDNGFALAKSGTCGSGTTIHYTIKDVPSGTYFLYACVFVASDGSQGPQGGDFLGIYEGSYPNNVPSEPNAVVPPSGSATFNIDLIEIPVEITPGKWIATAEFGGFDFVVDSDGPRITEIVYKFSDWLCGGIRHGGSMTVTYTPGRLLSDNQFEITLNMSTDPFEYEPLTISGSFDESGNSASGTWIAIIRGQTCSGEWQASPEG
jgi:hypothetical protein